MTTENECDVCEGPHDEHYHAARARYGIEATWFDSTGKLYRLAALPEAEQNEIKRRVLEIHAKLGVTGDSGIGALWSIEALPFSVAWLDAWYASGQRPV